MLQSRKGTGKARDGTQGARLGTGADQSHERFDPAGDVRIIRVINVFFFFFLKKVPRIRLLSETNERAADVQLGHLDERLVLACIVYLIGFRNNNGLRVLLDERNDNVIWLRVLK